MRGRRGFTLVDLMIALAVSSVVMVGMTRPAAKFGREVSAHDRYVTAVALAEDRLRLIAMDPDYTDLAEAYAGVERDLPLPRATLHTRIARVEGATPRGEYTKITVTVEGAGLERPIRRSIAVAAP